MTAKRKAGEARVMSDVERRQRSAVRSLMIDADMTQLLDELRRSFDAGNDLRGFAIIEILTECREGGTLGMEYPFGALEA